MADLAAFTLWDQLGLALGGAVAGLIGGLLGVGGGVILVPLLHLGYGVPLPMAVGTSLVVITGTSLTGAAGYLQRGLVSFELALGMGLGALLGAVLASHAAGYLPERLVAALFGAVLVYAAVHLTWTGRHAEAAPEAPPPPHRARWAYALAPLAGGAAGLLGIGGGIVQVPILRLLVGLDMRRAVATSTAMIGWTTSVAAVAYLARSEVRLAAVPGLLAGILAGGALAPGLGGRIPRRGLEFGFAVLMLWAAVRMWTK